MNTPVFDIIQNDVAAIQWPQCRMIIEIDPNHFYYTVLNDQNGVIVLKYYHLAYNNNQEMVNVLEEIVSEDPVLKEKMLSCLVIFNWPENCLVPRLHFDKELNKELLGLLHGHLNKGLTLSEKVGGTDMYIVYRIPPGLDDFLQRLFPGCTYCHYYSLWLDCLVKDQSSSPDKVNIIFNPNEIIAVVLIDNKLQLIQNLQYQTPEDIAWQLLNIFQRFKLNQELTPLLVGGMIDQNSATYEELLKYFQLVQLERMPQAITVPEQFQSFPEHFFSPLLKLAVCAS